MKIKQNGFTLIEIIISILILSTVSAVLLRLFITADHLNTSANDKSIASVMAANAIESLNSDTSPYKIYYDEAWQTVSNQDNWQYELEVDLNQADVPKLYTIKTTIKDRSGQLILTYETSRYFKGGQL